MSARLVAAAELIIGGAVVLCARTIVASVGTCTCVVASSAHAIGTQTGDSPSGNPTVAVLGFVALAAFALLSFKRAT
jgi:hypothetical protein